MSKITKKSVNTLMDIYKNNKIDVVLKLTNPANLEDVIMEVSVKTDLSIPEKGIFVDRVVNSCFDVDGDFLPQYLDPAFAITLLQMTTNVPVFEKEITVTPSNENEAPATVKALDLEKTYQLCKIINLVQRVEDEKYRMLVADLKGMVAAKLEYMKRVNSKKIANMLHVLQPMLESFQEILNNNAAQDSLNNALRKSEKEIDNLIQLSSSGKE